MLKRASTVAAPLQSEHLEVAEAGLTPNGFAIKSPPSVLHKKTRI
jgi:hypothetical protein